MKVLFINYHHLDSNSGIHIFNLANQLTKRGSECVVCVPGQKERTGAVGEPLFKVIDLSDLESLQTKLDFDLIHVWTPRESTRKITETILTRRSCPYIVHLEDNEEYLVSAFARLPFQFLKQLPGFFLDKVARPSLIHPLRYKGFLEKARGVTIVMEKLRKFCPENIPHEIIWAGYQEDLNWSGIPDKNLRVQLGIKESDLVICYTGNIHTGNQTEVTRLYEAIGLLNNRNIHAKLIRTGTDYVSLSGKKMAFIKRNYCIELGHVPRSLLPSLISISDILVQPGQPGEFNDYRFPSKLPEYLASGKPVILPKTNIGLYLRDREECLLLRNGESSDIAEKVEYLFYDKELRKTIGEGGRKYAEKHLKWNIIAEKLFSFYLSLLN